MNVNVEVWYHISLFCDRDTIPNIVKICKSLYNGCKIVTNDPICQTKITFNVICDGRTLGPLVATNDSDYAIIKKIIKIRDQLQSLSHGELDVVYGDSIRTYGYKQSFEDGYYTRTMKWMKKHYKMQLTTPDRICYAAVIAKDEPVKINVINNVSERKKFVESFYYQFYYNGKLNGVYYDDKLLSATKIWCKNLSKGVDARSFTIVRKIDNKHFYYGVNENCLTINKRKIECHLVLK
jgi:hypothetical protein